MTVPERLAAALADRYRIERRLGEGGMATVYLAEDLKHRRKVAVKVWPELASVLGAERFLREIKTTANLRHPHILPLFDGGQAVRRLGGSPDGPAAEFLFYVMPYIEGESLRDRLNREKAMQWWRTSALRGRSVWQARKSSPHRDVPGDPPLYLEPSRRALKGQGMTDRVTHRKDRDADGSGMQL